MFNPWIHLIIISSLSILTTPLFAAPGDLDASFGDSGKVIRAPGNGNYSLSRALVIDGTNRSLVVGETLLGGKYHFAIERYLDDGSPDPNFGTGGTVTVEVGEVRSRGAWAIAIQPDGKIVVGGQSYISSIKQFAVIRLLSNGNLDPSFSGDGKVFIPVSGDLHDVGIQNDGSIVLAGAANGKFTAVRLTEFGVLDTTFSSDGIADDVFGSARAMAIDSAGRIILGGYVSDASGDWDFALIRYLPNGLLDPSFSSDGKVVTPMGTGRDWIEDLVVQNDGKMVVVGKIEDESAATSRDDFAVARYTSTGDLDTSFSGDGIYIATLSPQGSGSRDSAARAVQVAVDGKIVVGGYAVRETPALSQFGFLRLDRDGNPDSTFGSGGELLLPITDKDHYVADLAIQRDGKIVGVGYWSELVDIGNGQSDNRTRFATFRIEGDPDTDFDGLPDYAETNTGTYISPDDTGTDPNDPYTDGDSLTDGQEVWEFNSNPHLADTDSDGFDDGFEVATGFDPASGASTPETHSIIMTAVEFRFNTALGKTYQVEASEDLDSWDIIETNIAGNGGTAVRFYTTEGVPHRFFRAVRE